MAVVGQQVVWKVQIDSRDDVAEISWIDTPAFANIRTERLPGLPEVNREAPTGPPETADSGSRYTTREEQRALFAERTGRLPIRSTGLLCKLRNGEEFDTPVPVVFLDVLPIRERDQPDDFSGVVGPLVLQTHIEPDEIRLGGTLHVTVSIRGVGNIWDAGDPFGRWEPMEADVFARKPELDLRRGTRLSVQKIFRYDVVPRSDGTFTVPPVRLSYFDPLEERFLTAASSPAEIAVVARQAQLDRTGPARLARLTASQPAKENPSLSIPLLALLTAGAAGILLWFWRRRLGRNDGRLVARTAGDADSDAAQCARALRSAIASLPERLNDEHRIEAAELLETLERSRFDPATQAPDHDAIERVLRQIERASHRRS